MAAALPAHMPAGTTWQTPRGGMFFWLRLPEGFDTMPLLDKAVDAGVAFVPGAPFFAADPDPRTMRLSFVTLASAEIREAVAVLGRVLARRRDDRRAPRRSCRAAVERRPRASQGARRSCGRTLSKARTTSSTARGVRLIFG